MVQRWITYSEEDERWRRRGPRRRRQWRWPWQWFRFGRAPGIVVDDGRNRRRPRRAGRRGSLWPLLLLLLLLLLLIPVIWFLLQDDSDEEGSPERIASTGNLDPSSASGDGLGVLTGGAPIAVPGVDPDAVDVSGSAPDLPSLNLDGDTTFMDLGEACREDRYVLMSDGKAHTIEDLDDATVAALARSEAPIDTIALGDDADTTALQTIAERTGGTFTRMER